MELRILILAMSLCDQARPVTSLQKEGGDALLLTALSLTFWSSRVRG